MARKGMTVFLHRLPKLRSDLTSFARKGSLTVASQCGNASSSTDCLEDLQKNARFSLLNRQSSNARTNKRTNERMAVYKKRLPATSRDSIKCEFKRKKLN